MFVLNPKTSLRAASLALGISVIPVHKILRKLLSLYPYKIQTLQALLSADLQKRLRFAQHCLQYRSGPGEYLSRIVFSDECIFRVNGYVIKQNVRIWGKKRPEQVNEATLNSPSVMVWCAISKHRVIGPYFFDEGSVTGEIYRNMLISYAFPRSQNLRSDYIFQHDGAPAHYATRVRSYLDSKRPGKWIGRGGPVPWPPRSPDLTPCDFFLWGHLKEKVYKTPVQSVEDLKTRIRRHYREITPEILREVWKHAEFRLYALQRVSGKHLEHTLH